MDSEGLRHRVPDTRQRKLRPPQFTIDLSLPPRQRYAHLAPYFRREISNLTCLFDEILQLVPYLPARVKTLIAKTMFRYLYDNEENEEIIGISKATGVDLYLLVAFNVVLDMLMGCTSGGARIKTSKGQMKMLHFRTLDWGMDPLRRIVVELDFVEYKGGPVVATTVTYFGYVGVLTGIRKGLSMSLNFRPTHDSSSKSKAIKFRAHQILVLLGLRRSVSSVLRQALFKSKDKSVTELAESIRNLPSTASYFIFCDGQKTVTMEKDHRSAVVTSANDFIVVLNNDVADESNPEKFQENVQDNAALEVAGLLDILSIERKACVKELWTEAIAERKRNHRIRKNEPVHVTKSKVIEWMMDPDIANHETHYGVIMDPTEGEIVWLQRYITPLAAPDDDESDGRSGSV